MKVMLIGGAGFVGSHTAADLQRLAAEVHVVDCYHVYKYPVKPWFVENVTYRNEVLLKGATLHRCDILDYGRLSDIVTEVQPEYVVNFAALPIANMSNRSRWEAFSALMGLRNTLEACKNLALRRYTYISSSMVYGNYTADPMPEDGATRPVNVYGAMKLAGEEVVKGFAEALDIPWTIVRPAAVYGPTDCNMRVVQKFAHAAYLGQPITVRVGADMVMDFTYVKDTARGIVLATTMASGAGQIFNITCGQGRSLLDLVECLRYYFEDMCVEMVEDEAVRPRRGASDIEKANKFLQYRPAYDLEGGLNAYVNYLWDNCPSIAGY